MPRGATIADIQSIAQMEALRAGRKILGITASEARYVAVPDDSDPNAVNEFVVDVHILDGPSQAIIVGLAGGLSIVRNVIIAHTAVGDLIADLHVPVEIQKSITGQLQVIGRAKVALPTLRLDEYSYSDLGLEFCSQNQRDSSGVLRDPFGYRVLESQGGADVGPRIGVQKTTTSRLNTAEELGTDDDGNWIGLGINPASRTIIATVSLWEITMDESVVVGEELE